MERKGPPTFWHPGIVGGPFRSHGPKPRGSHGGRRHAGVDGSVNSSFLYFSLPYARPVPVKSWSWTSWFGQWSPDPPVLCGRGSPSPRPSARHLETYGRPNGGVRRPSPNENAGRTAGSGDPRRTRTPAERRGLETLAERERRPNGGVWRPSPNENSPVITRNSPLFAGSGSGLLTRPSSATAVLNRRRVTWRPSAGRTTGSRDPLRTKQDTTDSEQPWRLGL